jgi:HAD superfamily hydrolase (TIGR01549 family)
MSFFSDKPWHAYAHMAFDIDGTLLNSNLAHVWAWQDAVEAQGAFMPHLSLLLQMGLPGKHIVEKFSNVFRDDETGKKIAKAAGEIYTQKYVELVAPYDGTHKLLRELKKRGKHLYAITSASEKEAETMMTHFELEEYFDHVMTAEEVKEGKPSAEPFLKLKEMIGGKADIVSFGDSPYDFKASHSAGLPFVYIGHGGFPREWFEKAQARFFNINDMLVTLPKRARQSGKAIAA